MTRLVMNKPRGKFIFSSDLAVWSDRIADHVLVVHLAAALTFAHAGPTTTKNNHGHYNNSNQNKTTTVPSMQRTDGNNSSKHRVLYLLQGVYELEIRIRGRQLQLQQKAIHLIVFGVCKRQSVGNESVPRSIGENMKKNQRATEREKEERNVGHISHRVRRYHRVQKSSTSRQGNRSNSTPRNISSGQIQGVSGRFTARKSPLTVYSRCVTVPAASTIQLLSPC